VGWLFHRCGLCRRPGGGRGRPGHRRRGGIIQAWRETANICSCNAFGSGLATISSQGCGGICRCCRGRLVLTNKVLSARSVHY
jgi:hypothetical protein